MTNVQPLEEINDLDCLIDGDAVNGICINNWGRTYSGKWTYIESRNWLVLPIRGKNSIATLKINNETKNAFRFKNNKFYITKNIGDYNLDFFNSKTEEIGQEINDYLTNIKK